MASPLNAKGSVSFKRYICNSSKGFQIYLSLNKDGIKSLISEVPTHHFNFCYKQEMYFSLRRQEEKASPSISVFSLEPGFSELRICIFVEGIVIKLALPALGN